MRKLRQIIASVLVSIALIAGIGSPVFAASTNDDHLYSTLWSIQLMPDGNLFDPMYYAGTYPDVANAFGYDATLLYQHYISAGKKEGRLPYEINPSDNDFWKKVDITEHDYLTPPTAKQAKSYEHIYVNFDGSQPSMVSAKDYAKYNCVLFDAPGDGFRYYYFDHWAINPGYEAVFYSYDKTRWVAFDTRAGYELCYGKNNNNDTYVSTISSHNMYSQAYLKFLKGISQYYR